MEELRGMQKLTVTQFRRYCEDHGLNQYTYDTNQQPWDSVFNPIRVLASYNIMSTFLAPASICFRNQNGTLCFESVKYVLLNRGFLDNSAAFSIVCGNTSFDGGEISYRIDACVRS